MTERASPKLTAASSGASAAATPPGPVTEARPRPARASKAARGSDYNAESIQILEGLEAVRQAEELARRLEEPRAVAEPPPRRSDPDLERVEDDLRSALGTKVSVARGRKGGRIVIEYYTDEDLGRLYDRLTGGPA